MNNSLNIYNVITSGRYSVSEEKFTCDCLKTGDCFCGVALSQLIDLDLKFNELTANKCKEILKFTNAGANLSTTKYGAIPSMPTLEEILEIL